MTDRKSRESVTRETETRRKPWAPPSRLAAPDAPAGFVHRWIRTAMRGEDDKMNVNTKLQVQVVLLCMESLMVHLPLVQAIMVIGSMEQ